MALPFAIIHPSLKILSDIERMCVLHHSYGKPSHNSMTKLQAFLHLNQNLKRFYLGKFLLAFILNIIFRSTDLKCFIYKTVCYIAVS